jgi:polar amino acid transport system substrate-binding protein
MPRFSLVFLVLICSTSLARAEDRTIVLTADDSPPYTIASSREGGLEGFMVDVARAVFEREGLRVQMNFHPYMRSIQEVREGRANGVLLVAEATAPGLVFIKNPISREKVAFFVRKGDAWRYAGIESLEGRRIATGFGFDFADPEIGDYIARTSAAAPNMTQLISGEAVNSRNFQKLLGARADVVIATEMIGTYVARQEGILDRLEIAGRSRNYIVAQTGFDPRNPDSAGYADLLSRGVAELVRSGKMRDIMARYGLAK